MQTFSVGFGRVRALQRARARPADRAALRHRPPRDRDRRRRPRSVRARAHLPPGRADRRLGRVPLHYVSKLARDNGTIVVQIGEGSDELFHGYQSYISHARFTSRYWAPFQRVPGVSDAGSAARPRRSRSARGGFVAHAQAIEDAAAGRMPFWGGAIAYQGELKERVLSNGRPHPDSYEIVERFWEQAERERPGADLLQKMTYLELKNRLAELLLMRVDKMTMANSVEARVPFLDRRARRVRDRPAGGDEGAKRRRQVPAQAGRLGAPPAARSSTAEAGVLGPGQRMVPRRARRARPARDPRVLAGRARPPGLRRDRPALGQHRSGRGEWAFQLWNVYNVSVWHDHWVAGRSRAA